MSSLGSEIAPPVSIGRPGFKQYPGPATGAILAIPFAAISIWGFTTFRGALSPGFYWFLAGCAALLVLMSIITTFFRLRFGITMSVRELGVVIGSRGQEHEIRYADIDALTIRDKRRYDETAIVRVLTRTVLIETAGGTVQAQFVAAPADALDGELMLLAERIAAQAHPREGKGWRTDHSTLHIRGDMVPLSTITAAGIVERDVRLWKNRETRHFFSIPFDSKNARVLLALTSRESVSDAAPVIEEPEPTTGIGRLLYDRHTSVSSVFGNTIMAMFVIACIYGLIIGWAPRLVPYYPLPAIVAFVLWILYSMHRVMVRYRFHERAVVRTSLFGSRTLAYTDVASMSWHQSAATLEGAVPLGTTVKAKLVPDDGSTAFSIRLHRYRGDDYDLGAVRHAIAHVIADKMHAQLDRGRDVQWTKDATFTRDGLVVKKRHVLSYDQPIGMLFNQGWLIFFRESWRKPLAILDAGGMNFYPGLIMCGNLMTTVVTESEQRTA